MELRHGTTFALGPRAIHPFPVEATMNTSIIAGSLIAALSLVAPLNAQQVAARVVVRSGPVAGQVVIGDGYSTYRRPVAYRRPVERMIVVERVRHSRHGNA